MRALPYTIRIFVPDGDPQGLKIISKMNWTGLGFVFPESSLSNVIKRPEFDKAGIYILEGPPIDSADGLVEPKKRIYVGQTDTLSNRLSKHQKEKDFWHRACVFMSSNDGLNRAHITWIEYKLIELLHQYNQADIQNNTRPSEPILTEAEKADTQAFLNEIIQILPLMGLDSFEEPKTHEVKAVAYKEDFKTQDTLVVPAKPDGFQEVFIDENSWYAVRIGQRALKDIKYIAGYQTQPISAITHYAMVDKIVPYGDTGKYKLIFKHSAVALDKPLHYGDLGSGAMQSARYTNFQKLISAEKMSDLF